MIQLTERHLNLPHVLARKYARPGTNFYEELVSAGFYGLVRAARTYDQSKGASPEAHLYEGAHWYVWNHIRPSPKRRKELFWRDRVSSWDDDPDRESVDKDIRLADFSPVGADLELRDEADSFLRHLDPRDRLVFEMRYADGLTLVDIGDRLGLSKLRVSQLLSRAREKLRNLAYFEGAA